MRRYLLPVLGALVAMLVYQWLVAPSVASLRDDLAFLHASRLYQQQQAQRSSQTARPPADHKE